VDMAWTKSLKMAPVKKDLERQTSPFVTIPSPSLTKTA
jgi:hypothetical protein